MPTQPFEPLLDRDTSKVLAKPIIDLASPIMKETVNYATNAFARCSSSRRGSLEEAFPVLASYLHIIQMTDSIEVLISNGCAAPAELLLRSSFEGKLTLEYMLEIRSKSKKRAITWQVKRIIDEIELFERFLPSHHKGKEFIEIYENDELSATGKFPFIAEVPEAIDELQNNLKKPEYAEVYSEYQRYKKKTRRYPEWYSLYDGPRNLRELAQHLHHGSIYEILYRSWSKVSHAVDASHITFPMEDGPGILAHIRNPLRIPDIAGTSLSFLLDTTKLILKEYRSGELPSFHRWWNTEIKEKHIALTRVEISGLDWFNKKFVEKSMESQENDSD